jgi:hypothetical protein
VSRTGVNSSCAIANREYQHLFPKVVLLNVAKLVYHSQAIMRKKCYTMLMQIKTPPGKYRLMMMFDDTWCDVAIYDTNEMAIEQALALLSQNPSHVSIYHINHANKDLELTRYKVVSLDVSETGKPGKGLKQYDYVVYPKLIPFSLRNMFSKWFTK